MRYQLPSLMAFFLLSASVVSAADFDDGVIRIGVINDRSGLYSDLSGEGSVVAARMAIEEFGGAINGTPIEILVADHQNKTDVGAAIARKWLQEDRVDAVVDVSHSGIALAIGGLVKEYDSLLIANASSSAITGKDCTPRMLQWLYNAHATAGNVVTPADIAGGMDTFFIIAVDYALGTSIADIFTDKVTKMGGKIVGRVVHPLNTTDFSSYFLQAQASGAKAILLANGGSDLGNASKQAMEFGVTRNQHLLAGAMTTAEIEANGLEALQGVRAVSFYEWNQSPESAEWAKAFSTRHGGKLPTGVHASTYSQVRHVLAGMKEAESDSADAILPVMRKNPVNDAFSVNGFLRKDGQLVHDMFLVEVKSPEKSNGKGDYTERLAVLPGTQIYQTLEESLCPLVK